MPNPLTGRLCVVTRRHVRIWSDDGDILEGTLASELDTCVGDLVEYAPTLDGKPNKGRSSQIVVQRLLPRTNCLKRSFGKKTKLLAANVDHLYLVAAPSPALNTRALDRVLIAATHAGIPTTLVVNKLDLAGPYQQIVATLNVYRAIGVPLLEVSVHMGKGLPEFTAEATATDRRVIVLTGISGVGKSSLLNAILPGLDVRTQEVSRKTGQGQQTTSQAVGHRLDRPGSTPLMVVDLPGIQQFGVCHLTEHEMRAGFPEFANFQCRFANCTHTSEPECGVLAGLSSGSIAEFRYDSYCGMLEELRRDQEY